MTEKGYIKPKKHLGQHFLKDLGIARKTVESLRQKYPQGHVVEIGPGKGVLTDFLLENQGYDVVAVELDNECIPYLRQKYADNGKFRVTEADFLRLNPDTLFPGEFAVAGNFPYNISTQIVFKVLEWKERVPAFCGMFQKEVAERICAPHGKKDYGILSVLAQSFYETEYLFTVSEDVFQPAPKVKSAVMRMVRKENIHLPVPEKFLFTLVKTAFNQRRKTLRNALSPLIPKDGSVSGIPFPDKRAEQLSVSDFWELAEQVYALHSR
jgi:16S rRNA (adenine1518-N6/adenine1519-N6)-dimethyltransferase